MAIPLLPFAAGAVLGKAIDYFSAGSNAKSTFNALGELQETCTVTVSGNSRAKKSTLYHLAATVGFGLIKRLVPAGGKYNPLGWPGTVGILYNAESKEVTFRLTLNQSLITAAVVNFWEDSAKGYFEWAWDSVLDKVRSTAGLGAVSGLGKTLSAFAAGAAGGGAGVVASSSTTSDFWPVIAGPSDTVIGGPWDFDGPVLSNIIKPTLPFAGSVILTDEEQIPEPRARTGGISAGIGGVISGLTSKPITTPNPRPAGDARSRGSLCWLVYQSLVSSPESQEGQGTHTYPLPSDSNRFSGG